MENMKQKILLAEDEKTLATGIVHNLERKGFEVSHVEKGSEVYEKASTTAFDLIILDVLLPEAHGFDICKKLREKNILTPVMMLTSLSDTQHKIEGLNVGADDYLGKPFHLEELMTRVNALIRRTQWVSSNPPKNVNLNTISFGEHYKLDTKNLLLASEKEKISVTLIEANLLKLLIENEQQTLSRLEILKKIWGFSEKTQTRTLDMFITRLRQHLKKIGGKSDWIKSIRGLGYRFEIH